MNLIKVNILKAIVTAHSLKRVPLESMRKTKDTQWNSFAEVNYQNYLQAMSKISKNKRLFKFLTKINYV